VSRPPLPYIYSAASSQSVAPNLITYNADETAVHFFKQPETPEEINAAQRAVDVCPTLAIGNDG
jgi:ferredoxin